MLVDFGADWCPPCRALAPTIDALADELAGRATVGTVDVDASAELARRFDVRTIPTVLLFADGKVARRFVGLQSQEVLSRAVNDAIRVAGA